MYKQQYTQIHNEFTIDLLVYKYLYKDRIDSEILESILSSFYLDILFQYSPIDNRLTDLNEQCFLESISLSTTPSDCYELDPEIVKLVKDISFEFKSILNSVTKLYENCSIKNVVSTRVDEYTYKVGVVCILV